MAVVLQKIAIYCSVPFHILTHSMQHSPSWEATGSQLVKKFSTFNGNRRFIHYRTPKCPPPVPVMIQIDQVIPPHLTSRRPISILSSHLRLSLPSFLFPSGFSTKTLFTPLLSSYMLHVLPISLFLDLITLTTLGEKYRLLSSSFCSLPPLPSYLFPLRPLTYSLKVNFTLEKSMKAQRWSRGISLLFL